MTLIPARCAKCRRTLWLPFVPRTPKLCADCERGRPPKARGKTGRKTWLVGGDGIPDIPIIPDETGKDGAA